MLQYHELPQLADIYLEDSLVRAVHDTRSDLVFDLDLVLTEENPRYTPPTPDKQYCYATGSLVFPNAREVTWLNKEFRPSRDAGGAVDYGNIDTFVLTDDGFYVLTGEWGELRLRSDLAFVRYA